MYLQFTAFDRFTNWFIQKWSNQIALLPDSHVCPSWKWRRFLHERAYYWHLNKNNLFSCVNHFQKDLESHIKTHVLQNLSKGPSRVNLYTVIGGSEIRVSHSTSPTKISTSFIVILASLQSCESALLNYICRSGDCCYRFMEPWF